MKRPKFFDFVKHHENYELVRPFFLDNNFPFEASDLQIMTYIREMCSQEYADQEKIWELYNQDDLLLPKGEMKWDKWESVVEQFETIVNHWMKKRLEPFIGMDESRKIPGHISDVDCFDEQDVNIWVKRGVRPNGDKREFFSLGVYDKFFNYCSIDWATETVWLHTTYNLLDKIEHFDFSKALEDPEHWKHKNE